MYMQIYIYVHIYKINIHIPLKNTTGCSSSLKIVFSQCTATHPLHLEEQLILERGPSVQSLLLVDHFYTANSSPVLAKERLQNINNSRKKHNIL